MNGPKVNLLGSPRSHEVAEVLSEGAAHELAKEILAGRNQQLIHKGLEFIDQGISIFDNNLALVAANHRFLELLDFPNHLGKSGTPLEAFFRFNAERGEYGPGDIEDLIEQRIIRARRNEAHKFQRERPDGTILEIQGTPIEGYGFVTTYSDVTEATLASQSLHESEKRFQDMALAASDWFWEMDTNYRFTNVSERFFRALGTRAEAILNKTRHEIADPKHLAEHKDKWDAYNQALVDHKPFRDFEYRFVGGDEKAYYLKVSGVPVFDQNGEFTGYRGSGADVTELREAQNALAESEAQLRSILQSSAAGVAIVSKATGVIQLANHRLAEMFHTVENNLENTHAGLHFVDSENWQDVVREFLQVGLLEDQEIQLQREDGSRFWALITLKPLHRKEGESVLIWIHDITELRESREELKRLAHSDPLTGLANRRMFQDQVDRAMARATRADSLGALLYFDLDGFKPVNDTFGHDFGDWLLVSLADRVNKVLRRNDMLSRLGGDEFTVLLEDLHDASEAEKVAGKIIDALKEPFVSGVRSAAVGASIGIAFFSGEDRSADDLIIKADRAMYAAKSKCKGGIVFASD